MTLQGKNILLVISGGIAAYKSLELIRLIRKSGGTVRCVLTKGGMEFITRLSVGALSGQPVYSDLFSLKDETEMGHIRLSREADLVVVAPASANLLAKMAYGLSDDLASTVLLATDKPVMIAPAMNPMMWDNAATRDNMRTLAKRGVMQAGPCAGDMACGETGSGRLAEPQQILAAITDYFENGQRLAGLKALVTSGPTHEPIDPVRFIGNRSSGKQGHAIAAALQAMGADVTLITGPVALPDPTGVRTIHVETAAQMLASCEKHLPVDIAVCAAAVADWMPVAVSPHKIKKTADQTPPTITFKENPDILATLAKDSLQRPRLVIGFAAETNNLLQAAQEKRTRKNCDWIVANDVGGVEKVFGADNNHVWVVTENGQTEWQGSKQDIGRRLAHLIADHFEENKEDSTCHTHLKQSISP